MAKDSLELAVGKELEIDIKGTLYKLSQASIGDWKDLRGYIRTQRLKSFLEGCVGVDIEPSIKQETIYQLTSHIMSENELTAEAMTITGQIFMLWKMLMRANVGFPYKTLDEFIDVIDQESMENMITAMQGIADEPESPDPQEGTD